ncbi:potassium/sodium hyperpolarization-activated cyclic nucleotide-gated channel 2-like [Actinia tenebrosa]|uniref:Potassium/sodium hyperpolarization-activated cyclic nucleotide-gated channel 2-like n=1 Tax=Actinia tenebrosa TaxID=6105 RepID=A0A6P8IX67_ACTTE|nr:potassium/sodium hyperpolarization-activated cyclic nucleotide-gated channel 2-like [Actinia tenebrosa]
MDVQTSDGEMHEDIPINQIENPYDVCDIGKNNHNSTEEKEKDNEAHEKQEAGSSLATEKENEHLPIEAVIVNIEDTEMNEKECSETANIEKIELEDVKVIPHKDDLLEKEVKGMPASSFIEIQGSSHRVKKPRRSWSVREHVREKHELASTTYLSASAPHLTIIDSSVTNTINMVLRSWLQPMNNRMNMKVFGSRRAMKDEQERYKKAGFVIHPTSSFRINWDIWVLLLLLINMFVLPVTISFFGDGISFSLQVFYFISDATFLLDILLNFRTGVLVHGSPNKFILEPSSIAVRYVKTWFFLDLISSLPFDYMVEAATHSQGTKLFGASRALKILRLAKLLSLLKLLRISRLVRYIHQYEEILNITRSVMRFTNLISLILLVAHWNGCMQFLVPYVHDFPNDSWVVIHNLVNAPWGDQYCWSLFKALSHMLCIGYGRHPPQNIPEACVTIFSMMTGATFYALFIALCISFLQQMDSPSRQFKEKIQQVEEYMAYRRLPVDLREKFTKYYEHRFQGKMFDEEKILHEISRPLRQKVINYNCRNLVRSVPFFVDADADFVSAIITNLKFEVYLEGDEIIREGELGTEMYFLKEGIVDVFVGKNKVNELTDGSYFGEISVLTNAKRTASVVAQTVCDVFVLHAEDFRDVVDEFPEMRTIMEIVAEERLNKMGKPVDLSTVNVNSSDAEAKVSFQRENHTCDRGMK